jgi:hypothetical protein
MSAAPPTTYVVKRVMFKGNKVPIAMQNVNGPCPLLAVANVLSLRGHFTIHEDKSVVTADELLAAVSDYLFDANSAASDDLQRNHERNLNDVIQMLPKTLIGIDVNVKFDSITSFEFTAEHMLFDFCKVRLVHGWLVDPQDPQFAPLRKLSYNQLVEKEIAIVGDATVKMSNLNINNDASNNDASATTTTTTTTTTTSTSTDDVTTPQPTEGNTSTEAAPPPSKPVVDDEKITQALLAEKFLNETATQLTYYGLTELHTGMKEDEMCVFFRNNHFNTLYKRNGELYILVTDQGYANAPLVWEKLCQIDGDSLFLRADFTTYQPTSPELVRDTIQSITNEDRPHHDVDSDLALALQLQDEENQKQAPKANGTNEEKHHHRHKKEKEGKEHCILQ